MATYTIKHFKTGDRATGTSVICSEEYIVELERRLARAIEIGLWTMDNFVPGNQEALNSSYRRKELAEMQKELTPNPGNEGQKDETERDQFLEDLGRVAYLLDHQSLRHSDHLRKSHEADSILIKYRTNPDKCKDES